MKEPGSFHHHRFFYNQLPTNLYTLCRALSLWHYPLLMPAEIERERAKLLSEEAGDAAG